MLGWLDDLDLDSAIGAAEDLVGAVDDGIGVDIEDVMNADSDEDDLGEGPHPTLLTGYGSYGISYDPWFSTSRFSLLDRGVAGIRGRTLIVRRAGTARRRAARASR